MAEAISAGEQRWCLLPLDRGYLSVFRRRQPKGTLCAAVSFRLSKWLVWNVGQDWIEFRPRVVVESPVELYSCLILRVMRLADQNVFG